MLSMSKSRGALWECLPLSNNCNTKTPPKQAMSALPRPAINPWPCPTSFYVYKNKGKKKAPKAHLVVSFLLLGKIPTPGVYFCSLEPGFGFGSSADHVHSTVDSSVQLQRRQLGELPKGPIMLKYSPARPSVSYNGIMTVPRCIRIKQLHSFSTPGYVDTPR